jgi:thymidylate synthase (FAD)
MRLVKPSFEIMAVSAGALELLERAGRTCYKSEERITTTSAAPFVRRIIQDYKHESVVEHGSITVKFVIDRGVSHELVRHRLCAFSQESTRYCNYGKGQQVTFVIPPWIDTDPGDYFAHPPSHAKGPEGIWWRAMLGAETRYLELLRLGWSPQQARSVLPNSLKTEIVATANFREWRHILKLRTAKAAHPQMREVMVPLCRQLQARVPVIFEDIEPASPFPTEA